MDDLRTIKRSTFNTIDNLHEELDALKEHRVDFSEAFAESIKEMGAMK